jgi:DinB family protein
MGSPAPQRPRRGATAERWRASASGRRSAAVGGLDRRRRRGGFSYAAAKLKIESPQFTAADITGFLDGFRAHERDLLVERLESAGRRLEALRPRLLAAAGGASDGDSGAWNPREIVGHLALVSKLYGVLAYRVASGKETSYDLLEIVRLRDVAGEQAAQQPVEENLDAIAANGARTLEFIRSVPVEQLERDAETGIEGLKMKASDIVRLALVAHFEEHLDQLESALG